MQVVDAVVHADGLSLGPSVRKVRYALFTFHTTRRPVFDGSCAAHCLPTCSSGWVEGSVLFHFLLLVACFRQAAE